MVLTPRRRTGDPGSPARVHAPRRSIPSWLSYSARPVGRGPPCGAFVSWGPPHVAPPASLSGQAHEKKRGARDHTVVFVFLDDRHIVYPSSVSDARTILCRRIGRSAGGRTCTCCLL